MFEKSAKKMGSYYCESPKTVRGIDFPRTVQYETRVAQPIVSKEQVKS
jgi:hypothetical protein